MDDETQNGAPFTGVVRRAYAMDAEHVVLVLERYEGDVDVGERLAITRANGTRAEACVTSVAWGSAFHADDPPLTLVVTGLKAHDAHEGAELALASSPRDA